ncbi:MAG: serine hydrolase domain-containing protein [Woeseiaceae bacterium]|nr:serine hydrolase domain-containing protein [Woeseiaceae bacterium]
MKKQWLGIILLLFAGALSARELPADPETLGFSADRLDRIDAAVERALETGQVAGAVVLVQRRGELAYLKAFGQADLAAGRAMRSDDIFRIASMTKAITATGVMILFEDGHFLLDDPVGNYLPEFDREMQIAKPTEDGYELVPAETAITIRHLLTHTSGISYRFMNTGPVGELYIDNDISDGLAGETETLAEFMPRLASLPILHEPGERVSYGLNIDVLGRLIEVVTGQSLDAFFRERIFTPLDMRDTYFELPEAKVARMAAVHRLDEDGALEVVPPGVIDDGPTRYAVDYPYDGVRGFLSGGGGLSSTAQDYSRFLQMILNGGTLDGERLLGRKTVELMTSDQSARMGLAEAGTPGFALAFGHDGGPSATGQIGSPGRLFWGGFFNSDYFIDPEEELVAVLMTQHYPYGVELLARYRVAVYQAIND